jgi:hypothetical protein
MRDTKQNKQLQYAQSTMKETVSNIIGFIFGLLLTPIWLPVTLIIYLIKKWQRKDH